MFRDTEALGSIYPALLDHAIQHFHSADVLRFLGRRTNTRFRGEVRSHLQRRWEGVRIKHWVEENWIKMYDKQGSVLRIETTINNPRRFKVRRRCRRRGQPQMGWLPLRKGIADLRRRAQICHAANERYLQALAVVGPPSPSHRVLDPVSRPVLQPRRRYRALRPISPEDSRRLGLLQRGEFLIHGFRNRDLRPYWNHLEVSPAIPEPALSGRVTRWLALLRAHGLIFKVPGTHYHRITEKGHLVITTALNLRHTQTTALAA